jgi:hypothetical protein
MVPVSKTKVRVDWDNGRFPPNSPLRPGYRPCQNRLPRWRTGLDGGCGFRDRFALRATGRLDGVQRFQQADGGRQRRPGQTRPAVFVAAGGPVANVAHKGAAGEVGRRGIGEFTRIGLRSRPGASSMVWAAPAPGRCRRSSQTALCRRGTRSPRRESQNRWLRWGLPS